MNSVKAKVVNEPNYLNKPKQIRENVEKIAYFKIFKTNRYNLGSRQSPGMIPRATFIILD